MIDVSTVAAGNIFVTRSSGWQAFLIRLGAAFLNKPNLGNHVAVMHHWTDDVPWGIEGKPGGVGWVDMRRYFGSKWTMGNIAQPIDNTSRLAIAKAMELTLGTKYDWEVIAAHAFESLHIEQTFAEDWKGQGSPGHVVCSSVAAWAYKECDLPRPMPGSERFVSPGDWAEFIITEGWKEPK